MTEDSRMKRLEFGALGREARTIEAMIRIYCRGQGHSKDGLCPDCQHLLEYARKRLACCPYGHNKPVCAKCNIHCYRADEKAHVAKVMRYAGPRLILPHPILSLDHMFKSLFVKAPEKPRNRRKESVGQTSNAR